MAGAASLTFPTTGADRSLITPTFFSFVPFEISPNSAPCHVLAGGLHLANADISGHMS